MKSRQKLFLKFLSVVLTFFFLYLLVSSVIFIDFLSSLLPGLHKTLYSSTESLRITAFICISTVIAFLLFMLIYGSLKYLWLKVFTKSS